MTTHLCGYSYRVWWSHKLKSRPNNVSTSDWLFI